MDLELILCPSGSQKKVDFLTRTIKETLHHLGSVAHA
jgi:hypothetical protein